MQSALSQIQELQREQVEMMAQASTTISEHGTKMQEVLEANMGFLNNWGEQFTEHLRESQGAIVQSEGKVVEQLEGSSKALASETARSILASSLDEVPGNLHPDCPLFIPLLLSQMRVVE